MLVRMSPEITEHGWGRIVVEGDRVYKDVKLFPGGAREWDWMETGTSHSPGVQPADVEELLESGARVIILSKGRFNRLRIQPETLSLLEDRRVEVHVLSTDRAVSLYNELRREHPVGALIHSTC
ncbi:MAG: hypothetical protein GXO82_01965 [Chlorobi bacterium]|nr:hypothetical protein [Chlorobiota bacterium]